MNLGNIYQDLGNPNQTIASTLKSLKLNPDNPDALMNLGAIYQDLGNLDQALLHSQVPRSQTRKPHALSNLGTIY